jgi:hypothetical protein
MASVRPSNLTAMTAALGVVLVIQLATLPAAAIASAKATPAGVGSVGFGSQLRTGLAGSPASTAPGPSGGPQPSGAPSADPPRPAPSADAQPSDPPSDPPSPAPAGVPTPPTPPSEDDPPADAPAPQHVPVTAAPSPAAQAAPGLAQSSSRGPALSTPRSSSPVRVPQSGSHPRAGAAAPTDVAANPDAGQSAGWSSPLPGRELGIRIFFAGLIALVFSIAGLVTVAIRRRMW